MSKIGRLSITIPQGVTVTNDGRQVTVTGPKGTLTQPLLPGITLEQAENQLMLSRANDERQTRAYHGLLRSLLNNFVTGVATGWEKNLELVGTGYRASLQGNNLNLSLGFSHPVRFKQPAGVKIIVEKNTITISGCDKELVGETAASIRHLKPVEPYKGKGIRYKGEIVRRKAGKKAVSTG